MRIGILGTLAKPITPTSAGGTEVFCRLLSQELVKRGHEVSIFASSTSSVPGVRIIPVSDVTMSDVRQKILEKEQRELTASEKQTIDWALNVRMLTVLREHHGEFDIIHDNTSSALVGSVSDLFSAPIVTTLHMPPTGFSEYMSLPQMITTPKVVYVAVAKWEQSVAGESTEVVYNGIDISEYDFNPVGEQDYIWIGRLSPKTPKGLPEAMDLVNETNRILSFAANVSDRAYFEKEILPRINNRIVDCGLVVDREKKNVFLGGAKAALFPIQWEEPFGFVFVEAMACGTPIIAYARGSVPEIIEDGITGFIVNADSSDIRGQWMTQKTGPDGMKEAMDRLEALSEEQYLQMRRACRERVERLFTVEKMVDGYEALYKKLLG